MRLIEKSGEFPALDGAAVHNERSVQMTLRFRLATFYDYDESERVAFRVFV